MDWTAGYASDVEYVTGFYREQGPTWLNAACLINGYEPLPPNQPYTYFELGFGRGLTAQLLAAANPHGRFFANDFNPSHVAGAARLSAAAGIDNLTLLEHSFEDLAQGRADLPQFDYITMHGVYTWVSAENRQHIIAFIARYLKPGGIVYVSYNAMPGWAAALPLQRLLVECRGQFPSGSDQQIAGANLLVEALANTQAVYLAQNPTLEARIHSLRTAHPNYLAHEYLHPHWQPLYHADVARDMAAAKLGFAGSADLPLAYPELYLDAGRQELLAQINNPEMRETLKDYFLNASFRKDVFVRGASRIGPQRQAELFNTIGLVLMVPRASASADIQLHVGQFRGPRVCYDAVLDAIALRPHTLAELHKLPALASLDLHELGEIGVLLCASNQAEFYWTADDSAQQARQASARRLNDVLAAQVRYGDEYAALCSPLLRSGVNASVIERLFYQAIVQAGGAADPGALARHAWQTMAPIRRALHRSGAAQPSDLDSLPAMKQLAQKFVDEKLPVWRHLQIVGADPVAQA